MKKILLMANAYIKDMKIEDFSLLKICLLSLGIFTGVCISRKKKKQVGVIAFLLFVMTYVPLISKFLSFSSGKKIECKCCDRNK